MPLTLTPLQDIPLIRQGDNLADIVVNALQKNQITLENADILVIAQKIISKAEGRAVNLAAVAASQRANELARQIDKDARSEALKLVEAAGLTGWDAGPIENSVVIEGLASVLININKRYGSTHSGIRITGAKQNP